MSKKEKEVLENETAEDLKEEAVDQNEEVPDEAAEAEENEAAAEEKQEDDRETQYLRLAADFQNYKRRVEKEKSDIYSYANEKFAVAILDVIDNFERAMAAPSEDAKFKDGVELILKQLIDVMEKNHVTEIKAEGENFDPNFHNAVMTEPTEDVESGKIVRVLQKGYMLNGKVIRPSMVTVAE